MDSFNWEFYLKNYQDLRDAGINNQQSAWRHFVLFGRNEGRTDKLNESDVITYDENGNEVTNAEVSERQLANEYILPDDVVFELGARYGSVSCTINRKLNNRKNQVVVEPDSRVWEYLEKNKLRNNCEFFIVKGFLSNSKLDLCDLESYNGYGTTAFKNEDSVIPSYTMEYIKNLTGIQTFNVLVADCEGFLETFLDENPEILNNLRLFLFEADRSDKCDYLKIRNNLTNLGFTELLSGHQNVWIR
jgi:hypothetical protein